MLELIRVDSGLSEKLDFPYKKHRYIAERYDVARDHLEHFDERLPGAKGRRRGKTRRALVRPGDLGNLFGTNYSFGGETWDVSRASLKALERMVNDYRDAIVPGGMR